jgi:TonB family protein
MLEPATESQGDAPSAGRLVIRIKLIPQEATPPPLWRRMSKSAVLIGGVAAALLSWLGISIFRSDPLPPPAAPVPAAQTTIPSTAEVTPIETQVPPRPEAPTSSINEVLPDVPQSALGTIRGTVRVSVRVNIDPQGKVVNAAAEDRGPSRYFERLSVEAAKQWTFTPARSDEPRTMLVRFNFTRDGATAHASVQP